MKKALLILAVSSFIFAGCNNDTVDSKKETKHKYRMNYLTDSSLYQFIPTDSANKMIQSYLSSINAPQNDTDLRSLIFNADSLRAYLSNSNIVKMKFIFAHTLDYINNGGKDQPAGYQSGALTIIVAGYDTSGNYVYYHYPENPKNMVIDHSMPCPTNCPKTGSAANDLLQ